MSWTKKTIGSLGRVLTGKTPTRSRPDYFGNEHPFVTPSDIGFMHYYCTNVAEGISELGLEKHSSLLIPKDAAMCVCIGNTIGKCAIASEPSITNQQINTVIANENNDSKFIYYLLCNIREQIRAVGLGGGAAQPIINKTKFSALEVSIPEIKVQQAISEILSAYDDLIENNRRRIGLLEEAARLLYREWFVYFRFPGHEHVKITDDLPEGWEPKILGDIACTNAGSYQAKELPDEINYIDISSVEKGQIISKSLLLSSEAPGRARRKAMDGDVIWSNVRPNLRAYALILEPESNDVFSTGFTILSPRDIPFTWLYMFVTTDNFVGHLVNHATGAGYPAVRPDDFERVSVVVPHSGLLRAFHEATEPSFRLIARLEAQNQKLAEARDLLLPRLMSGEITV